MTNHVLNTRTLKDAEDNPDFEVPEKNGKLKKEFRTSEVLEPMKIELDKQKIVKGRPIFQGTKYKKHIEQQEQKDVTSSKPLKESKGNWHQRVGQMSNKQKRQHGITNHY